LLVIAIDLEVLFQSLVHLFSLSISFGMISGGEVEFHVKCGAEGLEKMWDKLHVVIGIDVARDTVLGEDVENKELHELW